RWNDSIHHGGLLRPAGRMTNRTVAIIQARMGSQRLPGKVLCDIAGQSMLERVVRRVQRSRLIDETVVATSVSDADDRIVSACGEMGVAFTRGDEEDVLDRFRAAALAHDATICVRVCADSPLIDPDVCDLAVATLRDSDPAGDYASNKLQPSYPLGLDVEAFTIGALERAWRAATDAYQRSHVTVYIYESGEDFRLLPVRDAVDRHSWRWTVDTGDDLAFVREIFARLGGNNDFSYTDVVNLIENDPRLTLINAHVRPRAVLEG
ncbi:MAG: glycosyltransferase family protein, partial [Gemmatimonadaceae bacterium]